MDHVMNYHDHILKEWMAPYENPYDIPDIAPSKHDIEKNPTPRIEKLPLKNTPYTDYHTWQEFWNTGIITLINQQIIQYGWALAASRDKNGNIIGILPIRTCARALSEQDITIGMHLFSKYMAMNSDTLYQESFEAEHELSKAFEYAQTQVQATLKENKDESQNN